MEHKIELHITSDPQLLSILRATLAQVCKLGGFSSKETYKIILAVDEACANVIKHAYNGRRGQPIIATFTFDTRRMQIVLQDFGISTEEKNLK